MPAAATVHSMSFMSLCLYVFMTPILPTHRRSVLRAGGHADHRAERDLRHRHAAPALRAHPQGGAGVRPIYHHARDQAHLVSGTAAIYGIMGEVGVYGVLNKAQCLILSVENSLEQAPY